MRSFVSCGMDCAFSELFRTRESVVVDRPRDLANCFRLTGCPCDRVRDEELLVPCLRLADTEGSFAQKAGFLPMKLTRVCDRADAKGTQTPYCASECRMNQDQDPFANKG